MEPLKMLQAMCRQQLSDADVKAICKARGFAAREASSRAIFESFFLSDIGVTAVLAALNTTEIAALHLLNRLGAEVDVAFFARVYSDQLTESIYSFTYNQRYGNVYKQVHAVLVRRGLLLFAEVGPDDGTTTRLQRLRFRFPAEFAPLLPAIMPTVRSLPGSGEARMEVLREKLLELTGGPRVPSRVADPGQHALTLDAGELRIGKRPFRVAHLLEWQEACWAAAIESVKPKGSPAASTAIQGTYSSPARAVRDALAQLKPEEWVTPEALQPLLKVFCYDGGAVSAPAICEAGWRWGYLARQEAAGQLVYRLASDRQAEVAVDPAHYLSVANNGAVIIALAAIPYAVLEQVAFIADLQRANTGPDLIASPNLVRLGRLTPAARDHPVLQWLRDHAPAFQQAFTVAKARWGKQIVHTNLMVARITDPGLRVQIERALPASDTLVTLSDEYIAFPVGAFQIIEKMVAKAGYVIKTVQGKSEE